VSDASRRTLITLAAAVLVLWCARVSQIDTSKFADEAGWRNAIDLMSGLMSPDTSPEFLSRVTQLTVESLAIGLLGTALALLLGIPLAIGAAQPPWLHHEPGQRLISRWFWHGFRLINRSILAAMRSIPEIIWAFLFVRILGLGPGPAVLAIGVTFGGIIGKLYAELIESCDPKPVHALQSSGAGIWGVLLRGVLPQVRTQWTSYGLLRLECAVRSASILGVVGAGGIGAEIDLSIRYFQYDKLATSLLAVLACVIVLELVSVLLRRLSAWWSVGAITVGAAAGMSALVVPWESLWTEHASNQTQLFLISLASPTTSLDFVGRGFSAMGETLAIALCGTLIAATLAFVLAPLACRALVVGSFLQGTPGGRGIGQVLAWAVLMLTRFVFQLFRALPELVWALLFVVWVGPGPFAGVLAIGAHTVGILGRLYSDAYEETEPEAVAVLESSGASLLGRWGYGVLPQVAPRILAYSLFRFEVNIRASAMVGFAGAGGIGDGIHTAISLFHMNDLTCLLIILFGTVIALDTLGNKLRMSILAPKSHRNPA